MDELRELHVLGATSKARTVMHNGREHLVVPVVALMEGVIHAVNAPNPEYVPTSAFAGSVPNWNGRPLMLGHPANKEGKQISANDPTVLESQSFGQVFNTRLEGSKLLMDAYIDPEKAEKIGGSTMLERLRNGEACEVSIGAYVAVDPVEGEYSGKRYLGKWLSVGPDHLAFLPRSRGACSLDMGCGAHRAAMLVTAEEFRTLEGDELDTYREQTDPEPPLTAFRRALYTLVGARNSAKDQEMIQTMHDHATKLGAKCATAEARFNQGTPELFTPAQREEVITALLACPCSGWTEADRPLLMVATDSRLDAFRVAAQAQKQIQTQTGEHAMDRATVISALVANKHSGFTAGDEKMLEAASDDRLESFRVAAEARAKEVDDLRTAQSKPLTEEEWLKSAPSSIRTLIDKQQRQETELKAELVAVLKTAQDEYAEAELATMPVEQLQRMARVAKVAQTVDYSGRGLPRFAAEKKDDVFANPPDPYAAALAARK